MDVKSVITIEDYITTETVDAFGHTQTLHLAYVSAHIDRKNGQVILNFQIFNQEEDYESYNYYIYLQLAEFLKNVGAYTQNCNLEVIGGLFPDDEDIKEEALEYLSRI